ncbi:MAG: alanine--tRNA ligase, partial [Arcobacter sp.]|nr:alanine--tRNA ligase [Arcobacter sp.]
KKLVDDLKNGNESVAVLLMQIKDDKVMLVSGVKNSKIKAGDWIKTVAPIVGGNGGGRPDFASAGGKDVSKVEEAKNFALSFAMENV